MRRARLFIVILLLTTSNVFSNIEEDKIDYSSPIYNSSIQEDNTTDGEKENNSDDNNLKEYGPVTICANNAVYDDTKGVLTYLGNVFVMQIHNKHILCHQPNNLKKGVSYFIRDNTLPFKQLQQKWLEQAKLLCSQEQECNFISGQKLIIKLDKDRKIKTFTMLSDGDEKSRFYTFPTSSNANYTNSKTVTRGPVEGSSKKIIYDVTNKHLELYKKAIAYQNDNVYRGEKVIFDITHDLISIPGSVDRRSTIILDGLQNQTKIDTGLTPISQYKKKTK
ncbi:LptA/OstA family protein [Francisella hispaniensis]|uniref:Organic solvent tolerance-like N-terminal domain-containing protein n=1 Tax=Francisella hispaniensis TaxID=622488 RepID=F4BKN7_9GAMM|nr:LptA/OstA family protein [Francisella hispaniensis]AEB28731.1 hypothetical protein FN3523_0874 [Francisella hispaniensis]